MTHRLLKCAAIVGVLMAIAIPARAAEPFPPFSQPVVDAAGVVPTVTEQQVDAELLDYQARSGNQIAVAVVKTTGDQSIENYAIDLARAWGVGQQATDNGILLVIANDDRKVRIEVGRGLEGDLTDLQSGRIIRERLVPLLKSGDVAGAVLQGTHAIRSELGDKQVAALPPAPGEGTGGFGGWPYIGTVLGFGALAAIGGRRRGGRGGSGNAIVWGAALAALQGVGGGMGGRRGGDGFGGGGGGFGGGGASGDW